jgi:hypothetical protein
LHWQLCSHPFRGTPETAPRSAPAGSPSPSETARSNPAETETNKRERSALAQWHRIRLKIKRSDLESRQGLGFFRENIAMLLRKIDLTCIVCVLVRDKKYLKRDLRVTSKDRPAYHKQTQVDSFHPGYELSFL